MALSFDNVTELWLGGKEVSELWLDGKKAWEADADVKALRFTAEEANSSVTLGKTGSPASVSLETSTDGTTWTAYTVGTTIPLANVGDHVDFRAVSTNSQFATSTSNYYTFSLSGKIAASGGISYLLNKDGTDNIPAAHTFRNLFRNQTALTRAPDLDVLSASGNDCCNAMLMGTSITNPPKMPESYVAWGACFGLMQDCLQLTAAPELPAMKLADFSYGALMMGCTALSSAPELPAREIYNSTYNSLLKSCANVHELPVLHLTRLTTNCF